MYFPPSGIFFQNSPELHFEALKVYNCIILHAFVAQGLEHWSCKPGVESSNLSEGYFHCVFFPSVEYYSRISPCIFTPVEYYSLCIFPPVEYYSRISPCISPTVEYYSRISPCFSPQWNIVPEFPRNYILKHLKFIINYYLTCLRSSGVRALVL